jgi:opacity protein-like surface antigen
MQFSTLRLRTLPLAGIAVAAIAAGPVHAADTPAWTVSGFGTVGAVHSDDRQADFAASILKASGAGATRATSMDVDSRLGVQFGVAQGKWSGVLQLVSEQDATNSYRPSVEWGNLKYQATPDLALRAGRIALPMFLAADYRKVGYAYPWVRPPVEMYGTVPLTNSDGVDVHYRWAHGDTVHATQVFYGRTRAQYDARVHAHARKLAGFAHTVTRGALTARLSALRTRLSLDLARPLFDAYGQFGPAGLAVGEQYDLDAKRATAVSVGVNFDPGRWFATGEIGRVNTRSYAGDKTSFYLSSGYRTGNLTAYATFARSTPNGPEPVDALELDGMLPRQAAVGAALNHQLNDMLRYTPSQVTIGAGARWDVRDNVAVKVQYDRLRTRDNSYGTLIRVQPGFESGRTVGLSSVAVDFVF